MRTSHITEAAASQQSDAPQVAIFTTVGCPYCKKAKGILQEKSIAYQEIDVSSDVKLRQELQDATGQKTVPQASTMPKFLMTKHKVWIRIRVFSIREFCSCARLACHERTSHVASGFTQWDVTTSLKLHCTADLLWRKADWWR